MRRAAHPVLSSVPAAASALAAVFALTLVLGPVLAACSSAPSTSTRASSTSSSSVPGTQAGRGRLLWHTCQSHFLCADLRVPVSYARAGEGLLQLAVMALPRSSSPAGSHTLSGPDLLLNPGGPGESGLQFLSNAGTSFSASVRRHFNLVSWDPRGVGSSTPAVQCVSGSQFRIYADSNPVPSSPAQVSQFVAMTKAFDAACAAHTPRDLLENISTEDSARDLDRLRAALGQSKLTYLGFSYGTYLGYWYAALFPTHVRALVLDGAIDPHIGLQQMVSVQAQSLEVDLHDFFAWCNATSGCRQMFPNGAENELAALTRSLRAGGSLQAQLSPVVGGTQQIHYGDALTGIIAPLYSRSDWSLLAKALSQAAAGDGSLLAALAFEYDGYNADGSLQNVQAANAATNCADHPSAFSITELAALASELARTAPDFGPAEAYSLYGCTPWPVHQTAAVPLVSGAGLPPVVVVGSTHDPVTPFAWARALSADLPHSVLLSRIGDGHTAYFASACVQQQVDQYLEFLKLPKPGTVCKSGS